MVNFKLKNDVENQKKNLNMIEQDIMPNVKAVMDQQATTSSAVIEKNISKIDKFQEKEKEI